LTLKIINNLEKFALITLIIASAIILVIGMNVISTYALTTYSLTVNVHNAQGYSLPASGGTIGVALYDSNYVYVTERSVSYVGGSGYVSVSFSNLTGGLYNAEVYNRPSVGFGYSEFWGSMSINLNSNMAVDFYRVNPFITSLSSTASSVVPGQSFTVNIAVRNNAAASNSVKLRVIIDRDEASPWDFDYNTSYASISSGSTYTFSIPVTLSSSGSYYIYVLVYTYINNKDVLTDQYVWSKIVDVYALNASIIDLAVTNPMTGALASTNSSSVNVSLVVYASSSVNLTVEVSVFDDTTYVYKNNYSITINQGTQIYDYSFAIQMPGNASPGLYSVGVTVYFNGNVLDKRIMYNVIYHSTWLNYAGPSLNPCYGIYLPPRTFNDINILLSAVNTLASIDPYSSQRSWFLIVNIGSIDVYGNIDTSISKENVASFFNWLNNIRENEPSTTIYVIAWLNLNLYVSGGDIKIDRSAIESTLKMLMDMGFDGVLFDIEPYPKSTMDYNDIALIYQVRNELLANNYSIKRFLIMYAVSPSIANDIASLEMYSNYADAVNIMMYDTGSSSGAEYISKSVDSIVKIISGSRIPVLIGLPVLSTGKSGYHDPTVENAYNLVVALLQAAQIADSWDVYKSLNGIVLFPYDQNLVAEEKVLATNAELMAILTGYTFAKVKLSPWLLLLVGAYDNTLSWVYGDVISKLEIVGRVYYPQGIYRFRVYILPV